MSKQANKQANMGMNEWMNEISAQSVVPEGRRILFIIIITYLLIKFTCCPSDSKWLWSMYNALNNRTKQFKD